MESKLRLLLDDLGLYSRANWPRHALRDYQLEPARAIADSVLNHKGQQFAVVFSRQAGKDEMLAQLIAYLITRSMLAGGTVVLACPVSQQAATSMSRAVTRLKQSPLSKNQIITSGGYIVTTGLASARFMSAEPSASPRGQTASLLLVANEAQDIDPAIWDARFDPMAASTNATTVFVGTVWDSNGLLARQMHHLKALELLDGIKRVYLVDWREVAKELPAYGQRVRARIAQLGATHPYIKTEYMLEQLDSEGGLFPPARLAQLEGQHQRRRRQGKPGIYCLLIDIAGSDEGGAGPEAYDSASKRDSTTLTVVEVLNQVTPTRYEILDRRAWTNIPLVQIQNTIADLAENTWQAAAIVVDATGIGQGVSSFLIERFNRRQSHHRVHVLPFVFTGSSKSALGWDLIALIDSGRLHDYARDGDPITDEFYKQMGQVVYEIMPGPAKLLRWSVPQSQGHDDLVMSLALVSQLEALDLRPRIAKGT